MSITAYQKAGKRAYRAKIKHQGRQHTQAGFATREAAKAWMAATRKALKAEAANRQPAAPASMFSKTSSSYLEDCAARMRPGTVREKFTHLTAFAAFLGRDADLREVTPAQAQAHLAARQRLGGNKSANRHLRSLKALWNWAVRMGLTVGNPWTQAAPYPEDGHVKYVPPPEDVAAVLLASQPWERDFLGVLLRTGARAGELRAMAWDDVDLGRGVLTLWTRKRRGGERKPRAVTMSPQLAEILRRLWEARDRHSPYVFTNPLTGGLYGRQQHSMKFMMRRLCKQASVREFGLHALRHYVAVRLRDSGKASRFDIQAILGHQRSDTTDIYLRGLAPDLKDAVAALDDGPVCDGPACDAPACTPRLYPLAAHKPRS
jgi:integrase